MNLPPWVVGIGAMIACVVAGAVLITLGFDLIGIVVALASIPRRARRLGRGKRQSLRHTLRTPFALRAGGCAPPPRGR
jgi:hypothetical protein